MKKALLNYFADWNLWGFSWVIVASVISTWIGFQWGEGGWKTWLSVITMLSGLWCVILVAKGRLLNYYIGIISILGYGYIYLYLLSYTYQLYGETMLNIGYYLPMSIVGIFMWNKHKNPAVMDYVKVQRLTDRWRANWILILYFIAVGYAVGLHYLGDPYYFLDSLSTVFSIAGMLALIKRYVEQWILWIIVDVASIVMWFKVMLDSGTNDIALLVMWIAFLINAVYGYFSWKKMGRAQCIKQS
jgi:nicotinamide mononucleotide transporter